MAKLNDVKTIDTVNGEITKVAYDGAVYTKIAVGFAQAQTGDLFLSQGQSGETAGAFYEITIVEKGDGHPIKFTDDDGDVNGYASRAPHLSLFRKIEEASELTAKFNVGDVVVTLKDCGWAKGGQGLMRAGAIGKVRTVEGDLLTVKFNKKQPKAEGTTKEDRKNFVVRTSEVSLATVEESASIAKKKAPVIPQAGDVVSFEGFDGEYRKVDRTAQAGDVVVFTKNTSCCVDNGKPYLVESSRGKIVVDAGGRDYYNVYFSDYVRTPQTVDVYEKVEAEYVPQEGDIVVITANSTCSRNSVGDIGKVGTEKPLEDGGVCVYVPGGRTSCIRTMPSDIRKATPAEALAYEKAVAAEHKASFSVGDYVKIVKSHYGNEGAIAKLAEIGKFRTNTGPCEFKLEHISGQISGKTSAATVDQIVKATEQEVADASKPEVPTQVLKAGDFVKITRKRSWYNSDKIYEVKAGQHGELCVIDEDGDENPAALRNGEYVLASAEEVAKHADEAKWAQIGRKVGEFKKGDVVRVLDELCTEYLEVGQIVTVAHDETCDGTGIHVNTVGKGTRYAIVELIAPVESTLK